MVFTENSLVEFDADINLVPIDMPGQEAEHDALLSTADQRTPWDRLLRRSQAVVAVRKRLLRNKEPNRIGLATPCLTGQGDQQTQRLVLLLQSRYLLISDPRDFTRRATVVAQVEAVARKDEEIVLVGNKTYDTVPTKELKELGGNNQKMVVLGSGSRGQESDQLYQIVLRPLCIFK
jgi:hypothetical protein